KWHLGFASREYTPTYRGFDSHWGYWTARESYFEHINCDRDNCGKWHLGFASREYTPTYRGFDSHWGYWTARESYFEHINCDRDNCGLDFRHNMDVITNASGVYSTHYFTDRCLHIIDQHNISEPLFLYVPHQSVHSSGTNFTLEAPEEYIDMFAYIESDIRRLLAAVVYAMDESIGAVVEALHTKQMLGNSIILFMSDNGGFHHLFGIRVPAFIWSPLLNKSGYVSDALIHVTDLLPTVLDAINGTGMLSDHNVPIYGKSQWHTLSNNDIPVRSELIHNVDPIWNISAIRWYDWKLIQNFTAYVENHIVTDLLTAGPPLGSYSPPFNANNESFQSLQTMDRVNSKSYHVLTQMNRRPDYEVLKGSVVECGPTPPQTLPYECTDTQLCLFNIRHDPCEYHNLIGETDPQFVRFLWQKMVDFNETSVPPLTLVPGDDRAKPALHNNTWTNWLDSDGDSYVIDRSEL
ncbi:unnamed protein product, partial [Oppiella nova]